MNSLPPMTVGRAALLGLMRTCRFHQLQILKRFQNGFDISDHDLKFRDPGEILGTAQTGVPNFIFADLTKHQTILL